MANTPYNNVQPYLTITEAINVFGVYPSATQGYGSYVLGAIHYYAFAARGGMVTPDGQVLAINQNQALYSLLGTNYGGNGVTTFALPDLRGRLEVGSSSGSIVNGLKFGAETGLLATGGLDSYFGGFSSPMSNAQPSLAVTPVINITGYFGGGADQMLGAVWEFAGNFAPAGTLPCDGRLLNIADYRALYALLGTSYGGDGLTTFALPDLRGRTIVGSGTLNGTTYTAGEVLGGMFVVGSDNMPAGMGHAGKPVDNMQPSLVMDYYISLSGLYPQSYGGGGSGGDSPFIGEIIAYAGHQGTLNDTSGWVLCDGRLLPIEENDVLFSLLGTTYGGDGITTFALPDLSGRSIMAPGTGTGLTTHILGETGGSTTTTLTLDNIPSVTIHDTAASHSFTGANQDDFLYGAAGHDYLQGLAGNDYLEGNAGNDWLDGGTGADTMLGGVGDDTYLVDNAGDTVIELLNSGTLDEVQSRIDYTLPANVENLILSGTAIKGTGNNLDNAIHGNIQDNVLHGRNGADFLQGSDGNDKLYGDLGDDHLQGDAGDDLLDGGSGIDTMAGGSGNDTYYIDNAGDKVIELAGEGSDTVYASVDYTLGAGSNIQALRPTSGPAGLDNINLTGNELDQTIAGNAGNNILSGGGGADVLPGKDGNDTLIGGDGKDTLTGGAGSDLFVFDTARSAQNIDTITDFTHGVDQIELAASVYSALTPGSLTDQQFYAGASAHDADDRIIYDPASGNLYYDPDGAGGLGQLLFAKIGAGLTIAHDDFGVI